MTHNKQTKTINIKNTKVKSTFLQFFLYTTIAIGLYTSFSFGQNEEEQYIPFNIDFNTPTPVSTKEFKNQIPKTTQWELIDNTPTNNSKGNNKPLINITDTIELPSISKIKHLFSKGEDINNIKQALIKGGYKEIKGSKYFKEGSLIGSKDIDFKNNHGKLWTPTILQSSQDYRIKAVFDDTTEIKTEHGEEFTGTLLTPTILTGTLENTGNIIIIQVGSSGESLNFFDENGNPKTAQIRVPIPSVFVGAPLNISYSTDNITWTGLTASSGVIIDGQAYALFDTTHFTIFNIALADGAFTINNDAEYTNGLNVTLYNNAPGADQMRFGNSAQELNNASWLTYGTTYAWTLTGVGGSGTKTVYAEFRNTSDNSSGKVNDNIIYGTNNRDLAIKLYYFGTGNQFTTTWGTSCNINSMGVQYIKSYDEGGGMGPKILTGNTIYILGSGRHFEENFINFSGSCIVLAGTGSSIGKYQNTQIFSISTLTDPLLQISGTTTNSFSKIIIDNLYINGVSDGDGGKRTLTSEGIFLQNTNKITLRNIDIIGDVEIQGDSDNITIEYLKLYGYMSLGINIAGYPNIITINNTQIYEKDIGINIGTILNQTGKIFINNSIIHDNIIGIKTEGSPKLYINNTELFNNKNEAIDIIGGSSGYINNTKIYNNGLGIRAITGQIYYYGINEFTNNNGKNCRSEEGCQLITGNSTDFVSVGRTAGQLKKNTLNKSYFLNPLYNNLDNFFSRFRWVSRWGIDKETTRGSNELNKPISSYAPKTLKQTNPITYSGSSFVYYGTPNNRNSGCYITSLYPPINGYIKGTGGLIIGSNRYTSGYMDFEIKSYTSGYYKLAGDIVTPDITGSIGTNVIIKPGILIGQDDGIREFVLQVLSGERSNTIYGTGIYLKTTPPLVSDIGISGTSARKRGQNYFKGTISFSGIISDNIVGVDTNTCGYRINTINYAANYTNGYCYVNNLLSTANEVRLTIKDNLGNNGYNSLFYDNTAPNTISGSRIWARTISNGNTNNIKNIVQDKDANSYVVGMFSGFIQIGSTTLTSSGLTDIFVAKISKDNTIISAKKLGGTGAETLGTSPGEENIAIDGEENIYIIGGYKDANIDFANKKIIYEDTQNNNNNFFIVKYTSGLQELNINKADCYNVCEFSNIAIDNNNNLYTVVKSNNSNNSDIGKFRNIGMVIVKFNPNLDIINAINVDGTEQQQILLDKEGNMYFGFEGSNQLTILGNEIDFSQTGSVDVIVTKFSSTGQLLWANYTDMDGSDDLISMVENSGEIFLGTNIEGGGYLGDLVIPDDGKGGLISKLSTTGQRINAIPITGNYNNADVTKIEKDIYGNIYAIGNVGQDTVTLGNKTLLESDQIDSYVVQVNNSGNLVDPLGIQGIYVPNNDIAIDPYGYIYILGNYYSTTPTTYGPSTVTKPSGLTSTSFIGKYQFTNTRYFMINSGAAETTSTTVTFNILCPTDNGAGGVQVAYGLTKNPNNWSTCGDKTVELPQINKIHTGYVRFRDALGNITTYFADDILLTGVTDTKAPKIIFTGVDRNNYLTGITPATNANLPRPYFNIYAEITEENLSTFTYKYNNLSYPIYDSGLILMFNYDNRPELEENGIFVKDLSIYNNNGMYQSSDSILWTGDGKYNGAYYFRGPNRNGNDDKIYIDHSTSLDVNQLTLATRIQTPPSINNGQYIPIIGKGDAGYTDLDLGLFFYSNSSANITHLFFGSDRFGSYWPALPTPYEFNTRHYIVVTISNTGLQNYYSDGQLFNTIQGTAGYANNNYPLIIGEIGGNYYQGKIDETRIYNRVLSSNEIAQLYRSNMTKIDTDTRTYTATYTGLSDGYYNFSGIVSDISNQTDTTGRYNILIDTISPILIFTGTTPLNYAVIGTPYFNILADITETNLTNFGFNFNSSGYTPYDNTILLMMNFNNVSSLGENSSTVKDISLYNNTGTVYGGASRTTNGKYNGAYYFNGTNTGILIPNLSAKLPTGEITISSRIYTSTFRQLAFGINLSSIYNRIVFHICYPGGYSYWDFGNTTTDGRLGYTSPTDCNTPGRHHYVLIASNSKNYMAVYKDGIQLAYKVGATPYIPTNEIFNIGGSKVGSTSYYFSGLIDDFILYNRAISTGEIIQLYQSSFGKYNTDKWNYQSIATGLADGYYNLRGIVTDANFKQDGTGRRHILVDTIAPKIIFTGTTPYTDSKINVPYFNVLANITEIGLYDFGYKFNKIDYPIYDSGLILMLNYDARSNLGESKTDLIKDLSIYRNYAGSSDTAVRTSNGKYNGGYYFDGINDTILVGKSSVFNVNQLTIATWIKTPDTMANGEYRAIISKQGATRDYNLYIYSNNSPNTTHLHFSSNIFGGSIIVLPSTYLPNTRHYVAITVSSTGLQTYYSDGQRVATYQGTPGYANNNYPINIGSADNYYKGTIDETRIYNRVLSDDEIAQSYKSNLTKYDTDKWSYEITYTGLAEGYYSFTGTVFDQLLRTDTTGRQNILIDIANPIIIFTGITPTTNTILNIPYFTTLADITESNLSTFGYNFNGTNYPIYDSGVLLMMNFNNLAVLGENSSTVKDLSLYNNTGTVYGGTSRTSNGKYNGAYSFNGIDSYIGVNMDKIIPGDYTDCIIPNEMSFAFWAKRTTTGGYVIFSTEQGNTNRIMFGFNTQNKITRDYGGYTDGVSRLGTTLSTTTGGGTTGDRHYYVLNAKINNRMEIWIDGQLIASQNNAGEYYYCGGEIFSIGDIVDTRGGGTNAYFFTGSIDNFSIYNHMLSSGEINQLYRSNFEKYDTNKRSYQSMYTGLADGYYNITGNVSDLADKTDTTGRQNILIDTVTPKIIFTGTTPYTNTKINVPYFTTLADITESNLNTFGYNFNGINYPIYDSGVLLMMNFNNLAILGENSSTVKDLSLYNNTGTASIGAIPTANGKYDSAYNFNGTSTGLVTVPNFGSYISTGEITASLRIKTSTKEQAAFELNNTYNSANRFAFSVCYIDNNTYWDFGNVSLGRLYTTSSSCDNTRHHYVLVSSQKNNYMAIYKDGTQIAYKVGSSSYTPTTKSLQIGGFENAGTNIYYSGTIDDLIIYNRALSSGEAYQLYRSSFAKYDTNKRSYQSMYTGLADGYYNITGNISDLANQTDTTGRQNILIDTIAPKIIFTGTTPYTNEEINVPYFNVLADITEQNLSTFVYKFNGINYPIYDSGVLLMMNFNNLAILGENSSTVKDLSLYNNTGTASIGAIPTANGKYDGAYNFNGTSTGLVIVPNFGSYISTGEITASLRIKTSTKEQAAFELNNTYLSTNRFAFSVCYNNGITYWDFGNVTVGRLSMTNSGCDNTRHHYILVSSQKNNYMAIYKDGIQAAYKAGSSSYTPTTKSLQIGGFQNGATNIYYSGIIDDLIVYNRALSSGEAYQLYRSSFAKYNIDKWSYNSIQTGLSQGFQNITGTVSDYYYTDTTGRYNIFFGYNPIVIFTGNTPNTGITINNNTFPMVCEITTTLPQKMEYKIGNNSYSIYDSGLTVMMNMDNLNILGENNQTIKDLSLNHYNGTPKTDGGVLPKPSSTGKRGGSYEFGGGGSGYIEVANNSLNTGGLTISLRFLTSGTRINQKDDRNILIAKDSYPQITLGYRGKGCGLAFGIYNKYRESTPTAPYFSIGNHRNCEEVNQRQHIVGVISSGRVEVWLNGKLIDTNTGYSGMTTFNNEHFYIGGQKGTDNGRSGWIDEVRIYNRALSPNEIDRLYKGNLTRYDINKRQFNAIPSCLPEGNIIYGMTVQESVYTGSASRDININLPAMTYSAPSSFDFPSVGVADKVQTLTKDFTGNNNYLRVYDTKGYTGWRTTIQMAGDLTGQNKPSNTISSGNIFFKANTGIDILDTGQISKNIYLSNGITGFQALSGIKNYIIKDAGPDCSSCIIGKYGNLPSLKVTIPSFQPVDSYNGTIIFTLYN